ncbi:MAG: hypothetical protein BMS9Abin36_0587 [Gammaproteobacteria bacterium]|nr:MAG: hypothetical protein BMS9Abin36_0587 [Gammaproteobacteria bacterium]
MSDSKWERGSALSIFKSDRAEDLIALAVSLILALLVVMFIPK